MAKRECVICGALVKNINPKATTCGPVCTRAKRHKRTREEQLAEEMRVEAEHDYRCMKTGDFYNIQHK